MLVSWIKWMVKLKFSHVAIHLLGIFQPLELAPISISSTQLTNATYRIPIKQQDGEGEDYRKRDLLAS